MHGWAGPWCSGLMQQGALLLLILARFWEHLEDVTPALRSPSGFEFEPRVDDGEDGEDGGREPTGPHQARPCGANGQPVQRDEDVAAVLQQVQQQRRVAVQHAPQQPEPPPHPRPQGVLGLGGPGASGGLGPLFPLHQEAELVQVTCQAEDEGEQVVPADSKSQTVGKGGGGGSRPHAAGQQGCRPFGGGAVSPERPLAPFVLVQLGDEACLSSPQDVVADEVHGSVQVAEGQAQPQHAVRQVDGSLGRLQRLQRVSQAQH